MINIEFSDWFQQFKQQAIHLKERRLLLLIGDDTWAENVLNAIGYNNESNNQNWLVYSDNKNFPANVSLKRFRDKLGSESDAIIFADSKLTIDALASLAGTLVSGGVLFLLVNDLEIVNESLFFQRLLAFIELNPTHQIIKQNLTLPILSSLPAIAKKKEQPKSISLKPLAYNCVTEEQVTAVESIMKVLTGKRKQPLVLTADRGRGKSTALALACVRLLQLAKKDNPLNIIITAVDVSSLAIFFQQLSRNLPSAILESTKSDSTKVDSTRFITAYGRVEFIAVDQLLKEQTNASLVLVDEAAAIPVYLLTQLLTQQSRIVFASTVHGYEGAGRGFTLKFQQVLTSQCPNWRKLHIKQPIRYREGDPLEQFIFDACLLNAQLPILGADASAIKLDKLTCKHLTSAALLLDECLLKQVFAVLVTAHYQTKPSDLKMLLDNKQVQLLCLFSNEQLVAVSLLNNEGCYKNNTITADELIAVKQSSRRLKNHFSPQSLLTQCGVNTAFDYHYLRVMRIAVHPILQGQGIGAVFLTKINDFALQQKVDFLTTSFGATKALTSFWLNNGYQLARIGFSKDKASGEQSALLLKPLSAEANKQCVAVTEEFYRTFDYLLVDEYKYLTTELVALILQHCPVTLLGNIFCNNTLLGNITEHDKENIIGYAQGHRQYSTCIFSLHLWLKHQLTYQFIYQAKHSDVFTDKQNKVLISRIMQKHSINEVCQSNNLSGKKTLEQFLKDTVSKYFNSYK